MADISNKFLVFLLVIAILVSIIGTWYSIDRVNRLTSITGNPVGYVNVTIQSKTEINVTQPYCGFGTGYVTEGYDFAVLHPGSLAIGYYCPPSNGDVMANWTNQSVYNPDCIEVKNLGNSQPMLNVTSNKDAATMIGGTSPSVMVWSEDKDAGACSNNIDFDSKVEINDSANITICDSVGNTPSTDEVFVGCYLKIPKDASAGQKTAQWTFTAYEIPV